MWSFIIEVSVGGHSRGEAVVGAVAPVLGVDGSGRIDFEPTPVTSATSAPMVMVLFAQRDGVLYARSTSEREPAWSERGHDVPAVWTAIDASTRLHVGVAQVAVRRVAPCRAPSRDDEPTMVSAVSRIEGMDAVRAAVAHEHAQAQASRRACASTALGQSRPVRTVPSPIPMPARAAHAFVDDAAMAYASVRGGPVQRSPRGRAARMPGALARSSAARASVPALHLPPASATLLDTSTPGGETLGDSGSNPALVWTRSGSSPRVIVPSPRRPPLRCAPPPLAPRPAPVHDALHPVASMHAAPPRMAPASLQRWPKVVALSFAAALALGVVARASAATGATASRVYACVADEQAPLPPARAAAPSLAAPTLAAPPVAAPTLAAPR